MVWAGGGGNGGGDDALGLLAAAGMRVADISNYDDLVDVHNQDGWVPAMRAAGIEALTIGSQNMEMARWQAMCARNATPPMPVIATYAEPNVGTAIELAQENGAQWVCLVVEPGGIMNVAALREGISAVRLAGLTPVIYGNRGDLTTLLGNNPAEFQDVDLWVAAYFNDGAVLTSVPWWRKLWGHQFTSTEVIAGKPRDVSEVYVTLEDDMPDPRVDALIAALGGQAEIDAWNVRGNSLLAGYALEQQKLGDHVANAGKGIDVPEHEHVDGVSGPVKR